MRILLKIGRPAFLVLVLLCCCATADSQRTMENARLMELQGVRSLPMPGEGNRVIGWGFESQRPRELATREALGLVIKDSFTSEQDFQETREDFPEVFGNIKKLSKARGKFFYPIIIHVEPGSEAEDAGFQPGDQIRKIQNQAVQPIWIPIPGRGRSNILFEAFEYRTELLVEFQRTQGDSVEILETVLVAPVSRPAEEGITEKDIQQAVEEYRENQMKARKPCKVCSPQSPR